MKIGTAVLAVLSAASAYGAEGFGVPRTFVAQRSSLTSLAMSTKEKEATDEKKKDAPPVNIGWDSHKAVVRFLLQKCILGQAYVLLVVNVSAKEFAELRICNWKLKFLYYKGTS